MKLLSYEHAGRASWGIVTPSGVIDLAAASAGRFPSLRSALAQDALEYLARDFAARAPDVALEDIRYLPVIPDAQKIFCVGLNYEEHRVEANRPKTGEPTIFLRTPTSQVGHDDVIVLPRESSSLDYEGEIAIVIGRPGRRIAEGDAWSHIAGYSAYNDASVRDWQTHTSQWTGGKNFDATGGFGPWLVTRDEIEDDEELTLVTRLNGVEMQRGDHQDDDLWYSTLDRLSLHLRDATTRRRDRHGYPGRRGLQTDAAGIHGRRRHGRNRGQQGGHPGQSDCQGLGAHVGFARGLASLQHLARQLTTPDACAAHGPLQFAFYYRRRSQRYF